MPVKKFKTFEEAERDLWCFKPDEAYFERVRKIFDMAYKLYTPNYPKGVHKYKTFEEADADMQKWRLENALKNKSKVDS